MERAEGRSQKAKRTNQKANVKPRSALTFAFCNLPFAFALPPLPSVCRRVPAAFCLLLSAICLLLSGCKVGPNYHRPAAPTPAAFKELPPPNSPQASEWTTAQPSDAIARGKWWEIYNDPELNGLEEQVGISNQNIKMSEAQYREAKLNVKIARSY